MTQCMVRPCVARGFHRSVGFAVLHQCIRPLIGACCAPGHHGYQRACGLISCQASNGPFGSPGFASAGKTGPPFRFILSQTSAGKRDYVIALSRSVQFLCSCREAVPSSRPAGCAGHRAQGPSRLAVAVAFVLAPAFAGHALTVPSTVSRYAGWDEGAVILVTSKLRSLLRTAQAIRASLLASAIASTLWCSRFWRLRSTA